MSNFCHSSRHVCINISHCCNVFMIATAQNNLPSQLSFLVCITLTTLFPMCFRNYVEYSCPNQHILLSSMNPFTLCELAQHHPIQRQCSSIVDGFQPSGEWCIDCWMREHSSKLKQGDVGKKLWNDRWPGGAKWSGYAGDTGRDIRRDDVPQ